MSTVLNYAFDNSAPRRLGQRRALADQIVTAEALWTGAGADVVFTFTAPFNGYLVPATTPPTTGLNADIDANQQVVPANWSNLTIGGHAGIIPAGTAITVRLYNQNPNYVGELVLEDVDFVEAAHHATNGTPAAATVADTTHDNTAPAAASLAGVTHENTVPEASVEPLQQSPIALTNVAPVQLVIPGEVAPVVSGTPPTPMTLAAHNTALLAGVNYTVQVGSRSAPVTVTLPPAPSAAQRIEVVDTSGQGALHPITVDAGAVDIETAGTKTYLVNRNDAVLALYYTGAKWKLI